MKKFLALAALVLGLASCQTEPEGLDVNVGGAVDTVVTVNIPEAETRANNSGIGVFENGILESDDYTVRYIFQVYYNGETNEASRQVKYTDGTSVSFPVRLVPGRDYQFVVWADVVKADKQDLHYNTTDLKNITLSNPSTWVAMDETRDAFTASHKAVKYNGSQAINIDLYRPFAKLRVVTTDYTALANLGAGIKAKTATVKYTTDHRSAFNAYTSKAMAADKADVEHTQYTIAEYTDEDDASRTIFSDYFFAENGDIVKFEMTVYDTNGQEIVTRVFNTDINVNRNYLTTIKGNILTDGNDINVEVKPGFGGTENPDINYNVITTGSELIKAIENGGSYLVGNDIYVSAPAASTLATRADAEKHAIINVNGRDVVVENKGTTAYITLTENHTVTFTGKGSISMTADSTAPFISKGEGVVNNDGVEIADNVIDGTIFSFADYFKTSGEKTLDRDVTIDYAGTYVTVPADVEVVLDLGGHTVMGYSVGTGANQNMIDVRGKLTIKNGTIITKHNADNMAWGNSTNVFNVTAGGVLNIDDATIKNNGGSDMAFVAHLNNWGEVTLNVEGSTLESPYIPVRVFNSGNDINNVTIKNSTLKSESRRVFWVHNYTLADFGNDAAKTAAHQALLNFDIFNGTNTFESTNPARVFEYGFTDAINFDADGNRTVYDLESLKLFAAEDNRFENKTVKLYADIDLNNEAWTPIAKFLGTFDGQDHTISNLKVTTTDKTAAGFFSEGRVVKNLKFENVNISGNYKVGTVVGYGICSRIENCHVKNGKLQATVKDGDLGNHVGGITGYLSQEFASHSPLVAFVKNCSVENVEIVAYRDLGGLIGTITGSGSIKPIVENNTVKDVKVIANRLPAYGEETAANAAEVVGRNIKESELTTNTVINTTVDVIEFDATGTLEVSSATALTFAATAGIDFEGKTIKLAEDVDLSTAKDKGNSNSPIGRANDGTVTPFNGTFDGQGHAIKNLYQSGWDFGYEWGSYGSIGLFAELEGATVKNVVIEGLDAQVEGGDISFIAGSATGDCVFENITIKNSTIGTYNNGCGGIIGWSGAGTYTFKNIKIAEDVVLGGLWGSFDSSIGGIVGQAEPGATYNFENVEINCRIDAYNDCTASYDYYNYRMCGMIVGRCAATTTINGSNYPDLSKYNFSFNNVVVNYGTWMNYHYCDPTPGHNNGRGMRIEPGYAYGGLPEDYDHSQCTINHMACIPFDQLIGGDQYGVKGLREVDGVTVNYPDEYTCPLCGNQHNVQ